MPSYETVQKFLADVRDFIIDFVATLKDFIAGFRKSARFDYLPDETPSDELV